MKISLNWLRELGKLPINLSPEEIGEKITLHTAELEEVISIVDNFSKIFPGKLVEANSHPNSDKLTIGTFDCGPQGIKQIIFGTVQPLVVGNIYPVALDGAILGNGQTITNGEIKGEKSEGMICDNSEMGMKNGNLLTFEEKDLGKALPEICSEFNDFMFDIDNKSLTHRPDLMGHIGFSREYSAIFNMEKNVPNFSEVEQNIPENSNLKIEITSPHCRRFMGVKISKIKVENSKLKDIVRLENLGTRAISNIVDITNMVMLEYGQPMHAFDASKISGKIIVRQAKQGETIIALDEEEYELTSEDIVIADSEKILSIAGIMGGLESAVTADTTEIIFESANFDPTVIRKTSSRLGLRSESSMRFEKSLDPENTKNGILAALKKLTTDQPNVVIETGITDIYTQKGETKTIELSLDRVRKVSGIEFANAEIISKLEMLDFIISGKNSDIITVDVPSFRATKDIAIAEDLIEEIVRLHGFANIEEKLPTLPLTPPKENQVRKYEWNIRDFFSAKKYSEVYLTSFVSPDDQDWIEENDHIAMINATNNENKFLRKTLASNMTRNLENELRKHKKVSIFEIGKIHTAPSNETLKLGILKAEFSKNGENIFYELKQDIIELFMELNGKDIQFKPTKSISALEHPHQTAEIFIEGKNIGKIFSLHPSKNETKKSVVVYSEINLEILFEIVQNEHISHQKISEFPISTRDLSIVLQEKILIGDIEKTIQNMAQNCIKVELFDEYRDEEKLGKELKNLAFHLYFQSKSHTLDHDEVESEFASIVQALNKNHLADLRVDFDNKKS